MMHKGARLRRMVTIDLATKHTAVGTADCGHLIVRMNHLAVGQRVYCGECPPPLPVAAPEGPISDANGDELERGGDNPQDEPDPGRAS